MDHRINTLIIGAGGVASYLLPILHRTFPQSTFVICDGDTLEERNLDRQAFHEDLVGGNKADAIASMLLEKAPINRMGEWSDRIISVPQFFTGTATIPEAHAPYLRLIICVADNHEARKLALEAADELKIPCIIGANELFDSESYIYLPEWKAGPNDPRVKHPEILTDLTGSPLHCQEQQEISPQLAIANFACAGKIATMVWRWLVEVKRGNKIMLHHENLYDTITELPKA